LAQSKQFSAVVDKYITLAAAANSKEECDAFLEMARSWLRTTALAETRSIETHHPKHDQSKLTTLTQPRPHE